MLLKRMNRFCINISKNDFPPAGGLTGHRCPRIGLFMNDYFANSVKQNVSALQPVACLIFSARKLKFKLLKVGWLFCVFFLVQSY